MHSGLPSRPPHPTLPGERLLTQATTLSGPVYITAAEVTLRARESRGRERFELTAADMAQTSYAYDGDGNLADTSSSDDG